MTEHEQTISGLADSHISRLEAEIKQLKAKNEDLHQDRVRYHRLRAMMISNSKFQIPNEEADKAVDALIAEEAARVFRGERQ